MAKADTSAQERLHIINLRNSFRNSSGSNRGKDAIRYLRSYFEKTLKGEGVNISISQGVNQEVLKSGVKHPAHKIKVKVIVEEDTAKVMLPEEKEPKKKKIRKLKPQGTKSKLQEMLAAKTAAQPAEAPKEKKAEPAVKEEKKKTSEEKFEEHVQVDKEPKVKNENK